MCYSAQIWADYKRYVRQFGAELSIKEFFDLFWRRRQEPKKVLVPKALGLAFARPESEPEREIKALIDAATAEEEVLLQKSLFEQKTRLVQAERKLQEKATKAALEHQRNATNKIATFKQKLADLHRTDPVDDDARMFPRHHVPVMVSEQGRRVIRPMRFLCRPEGKPAAYDIKYPGTYNARRDKLGGDFWKGLWGRRHGIVVASAFYENVNRHRAEGRALAEGEAVENMVLEFRPRPAQDMLLACLWSDWRDPTTDEHLLSFALITDEPPEEVAAAGHDRCVIPLRSQHLDAWLNPDRRNLAAMQALLDDRERPYFEHRSELAA
jgi:putative SOS response-associated peptidase YedK